MEEGSCVILINVGNLFINFERDQGKPSYHIKALLNFKVIWSSLKFGHFLVLYFF